MNEVGKNICRFVMNCTFGAEITKIQRNKQHRIWVKPNRILAWHAQEVLRHDHVESPLFDGKGLAKHNKNEIMVQMESVLDPKDYKYFGLQQNFGYCVLKIAFR